MRRFIIAIFVFIILIVPAFTFAVEREGVVPCDGPECQACHFVQLGQNLLEWAISVIASIVALVFAIGGLRMAMAGGDTHAVDEAKKMMTNAVVGFIILLSAWLVVDTVLKTMIDKDNTEVSQKLGVWHTIECVTLPIKNPPTSTDRGTLTPTSPTEPVRPALPAGKLSDAEARALLEAAQISVNKTEAEGTSLEGINKATIQDIVSLKNQCGCEVIFTGGTEGSGGHETGTLSHGTGYKYDVRVNEKLDNYIQTSFTPSGTRSDGAPLYTNTQTGTVYAREGNHWDALVSS